MKIKNFKLKIDSNLIKTFYFILILAIVYLTLYMQSANAQTMTNSDYILQMGNLNSFSGQASNPTYNVTYTGGQTGANLFSGPNYKVKLGFQYIYPFTPFRFSISSLLVDFGIISPTVPVTRSNVLTVNNSSAYGYEVTVSQNHNMRVNTTGQEIPATTCDSSTPCTTTSANSWTDSVNSFGLGYNCANTSGTECPADFTNSNYFRPFASSPSAVIVMSNPNVGTGQQVTITYKVNIPQNQAAGTYTNVLNYIATPSY